MGNVIIMDHPLIKHKIGLIRDKSTGTKDFRAMISEIAMLAAESSEPTQYSAPFRVPQPVAWYTFDDPTNPGKDSSGNGYDLTPVGDVNVVDSPVKGGMLSMTGTVMS